MIFISSTEFQWYKLGYFNCCICSYFRRILHDFMRPQKKSRKSSGYDQRDGSWRYSTDNEWIYGVLIDISDEDVIVEFGSNKNCRIPMQKAAIAQVEKASAE